ncbi:MAG: GntR family transcriptional regulator [Sphaerochaetaceae bacterium]|nr:GntR family transcriptional regulator [Sphaerochaetaceae bacterium]
MIQLEPIRLLPARERVASVLRKSIISQDIAAGAQITLESIAEQVGVSITPVREAFQMLESEGLLKLYPNKGAVVKGITPRSVKDHFQIRAALESEAVAIVTDSQPDLTEIREIIEKSDKVIELGDFNEYGNLNQAFHIALWTASKNHRLKDTLSVMWNGLSMRYMESVEEYAVKSLSEHKKILSLIEKGDIESARKAMHEHIERSMQDMLTNLEVKKN